MFLRCVYHYRSEGHCMLAGQGVCMCTHHPYMAGRGRKLLLLLLVSPSVSYGRYVSECVLLYPGLGIVPGPIADLTCLLARVSGCAGQGRDGCACAVARLVVEAGL